MAIITDGPKYRPIPSASGEAKTLAGVAVLGAAVVLSNHEHTDLEVYSPMPPASNFAMPAQSTSSGPMIVGYDGANDVAIRNQFALRDAHTRIIAGVMPMGSPAVLMSSTAASMTWIPTYPALPGR